MVDFTERERVIIRVMSEHRLMESPAGRGFMEVARFAWHVSRYLLKPAFLELSSPTGLIDKKRIGEWQLNRTVTLVTLGIISSIPINDLRQGFTLDGAHVVLAIAAAFGAGNLVDWTAMGLVKLGSTDTT